MLAGATLVVAAGLAVFRFLAPIEPARGARTLVVEGWVDERVLKRAAAVARAGRYARVLTTGGPIEPWMDRYAWGTFAARGARLLQADGDLGVPVVALPAPDAAVERTFQSAVQVRDWVARSGLPIDALDLLTADVHARRSWLLYRMVFGRRVEVGILADRDDDPTAGRWWRTSASAKRVLGEAIAWAWTECCFWPEVPAPP